MAVSSSNRALQQSLASPTENLYVLLSQIPSLAALPNRGEQKGESPVSTSDLKVILEKTKNCIRSGADVNLHTLHWTTLHLAVTCGDEDFIWTLLAKGANPSLSTSRGFALPHRRKAPLTSFTIRKDSELNIWYRPTWSGFASSHGGITEDNLNFLKIYCRHRSGGSMLSRKDIQKMVADINYDSDLWDDIYDNEEIFRPVEAQAMTPELSKEIRNGIICQADVPTTTEQAIKRHYMSGERGEAFAATFQSRKDCYNFILDRINVFKFYIFLRRCAILYRDTAHKDPFRDLINFLEKKPVKRASKKAQSNLDWLKSKIRVKSFEQQGEKWPSGLHEWLTCDSTVEALRRTAGEIKNVEPALSECIWGPELATSDAKEEIIKLPEYFCSEFNWIDLQLLLRTPTKYVAFISAMKTIENGHMGAVNKAAVTKDGRTGFETAEIKTPKAESQKAFHDVLNDFLKESHSITDFVTKIHSKYTVSIFHDKTRVLASSTPRYLVDGTATNDLAALEKFKSNHLAKPSRYMKNCADDISLHARLFSSPAVPNPLNQPTVKIDTPVLKPFN